jgi:hypothetical protein
LLSPVADGSRMIVMQPIPVMALPVCVSSSSVANNTPHANLRQKQSQHQGQSQNQHGKSADDVTPRTEAGSDTDKLSSLSSADFSEDSGYTSSNDSITANPDSIGSVGSAGHPYSCGGACKYNSRKGCKEGAACTRCHLCFWSRASERAMTRSKVQAKADKRVNAFRDYNCRASK